MPIADKEARARSFGAVADQYQRGRAGYTAWDSDPELRGREATTLHWRTSVRHSHGLLPR